MLAGHGDCRSCKSAIVRSVAGKGLATAEGGQAIDPLIIALARAYAFALEVGYSEAQARARLENGHLPAEPGQIDAAIAAYQEGLTIAGNIANLIPGTPLYEALGGADPVHTQVGVRVRITIYPYNGEAYHRTVYVDLNWNDPVDAIDAAVDDYLRSRESIYGTQNVVFWELEGPTFWAPA